MLNRNVRNLTIPAVLFSVLGACSSNDNEDLNTAVIAWQPCTGDISVECGSLTVPVDYSEPDGDKIDIAMRRLVANNTDSNRILLYNPGGPGASGIKPFKNVEDDGFFPQALRDEFTIIGFDPRGVGESEAVSCTELGFNDREFFPLSEDDIRNHVNTATLLADKCFEKYGDYLLHLGTNNVVRDMEEIRKASGADKVDFIGFSYGTRLGALFLQTFPESSGAFVLDGVVSSASTAADVAAPLQTTAMKRTLEALLGNCTELFPGCTGEQLVQRLENRLSTLHNALETNELPDGIDSFDLLRTEIMLVLNVAISAANDRETGPFSRGPLIAYLENFDLTPLADYTGVFEPENTDDNNAEDEEGESEEGQGDGNGNDVDSDEGDSTALIAIWCADDIKRPTTESLLGLLSEMNAQNEIFAEVGMPIAAFCAGWKPAIFPLETIVTSTAPQALLIGGTADEITPIEMLYEMSTAIGGYAVSSDHIGHTVVFDRKSRCVDDQVISYLVDGLAPSQFSCPLEE